MKISPFLTLSLLCAALFAGCSAPDKIFGGLLVEAPPEIRLTTNAVPDVVVRTDPLTGATLTVTNFIERVSTVTNTVYAVSPAAAGTIEAARAVTPLIPAPFGMGVELALTAGAAALAWFARQKSRQNKSLTDQIGAVIQGVEKATRADKGSTVKHEISAEARKAGVGYELHRLVKTLTLLALLAFPLPGRSQGTPPPAATNIVRLTLDTRLVWDANPEPDIAGYYVQMLTGGQVTEHFTTNNFVSLLAMAPGLTNGPRSFRVIAVNRAGLESDPSDILSANLAQPPSKVIHLILTTSVRVE